MPRLRRVPSAVVELLRLCVVVFFAGLGYYVAGLVDDDGEPVLGALSVLGVGVVLGSALGYVLGGVLGRGTVDRGQGRRGRPAGRPPPSRSSPAWSARSSASWSAPGSPGRCC